MGIGELQETSLEAAASTRLHGCAGPRNPFTPFDVRAIEGSVVARFEAQVARNPAALAITDATNRWSYAELNGFANRTGAELIEGSEARQVPVALLFEHGAAAVAAVFGALKAGRCYVPLNTSQPAERLRAILKDSGAKTLVTNNRNAELAREICDGSIRIVPVDAFAGEGRADNLGIVSGPRDPAMILFTSGSTGLPKGVVHNHRNILHNVSNVTNYLRIDASDRLDQLYSYDTGAWIPQTFASLLNGASVHLFDLRSRNFADLADWMARQEITIYHSVPQVFRHLVAALAGDASFPSLRLIRLGGEAAALADVELYWRYFSKTAMLQISLGSTEIAPIRGLFIDGDTNIEGSIVPTGYEMPDVEVLILDDDGNEVAPGTAGQIAIRSDFLFCDYWNNPSLTASVITAAPDGKRIFRTGDRGMLIDDGCLIHLGRRESMVKIGGMAVEVAEVEAALLKDDGVKQAAVVGRPDRSGEMRLIAYVVGTAATRELRARLARKLPAWMIPATFVRMDSLPLNRNGKIDRAALPNPVPPRYGEHRARDPLEAGLVAIWEELLKLRPIGIRDDFFQLGGDSLLAVDLVTNIEARLGREVPVSILAEHPTIEQQAEVLRSGKGSRWPSIVPLQLRGRRPPIFFVPGAGSDVISLIGFARGIGIEQPFYGLQPPGYDHPDLPLRGVEELAAYFLSELRVVRPQGPYLLGGASYGGLVAFEMAQRLTAQGERVAFLGLLDTHAAQFPRMHSRAPLRFRMFQRLVGSFSQSPRQTPADVARHAQRVWEARFFNRLRRIRGLPLSREGRYLHFYEQAVRIRRSYRIRPYPGKVTLFRYAEQPSPEIYDPDSLMGWGAVADSLEIVDVPGTHTHLSPAAFREICQQLRERIEAAQAEAASFEP